MSIYDVTAATDGDQRVRFELDARFDGNPVVLTVEWSPLGAIMGGELRIVKIEPGEADD